MDGDTDDGARGHRAQRPISLPALSTLSETAGAVSERVESRALARRRARRAVRQEQGESLTIAFVLAGWVLLLAGLALSVATDLWPSHGSLPEDASVWPRSALALAGLGLGTQLVCLLMVLEHTVVDGDKGRRHAVRLLAVRATRLVIALVVLSSVWVISAEPSLDGLSFFGVTVPHTAVRAPSWVTEHWSWLADWWHVFAVIVVAEAVMLGILALARSRLGKPEGPVHAGPKDRSRRSVAGTGGPGADGTDPAATGAEASAAALPLRAIGASGGGIRAAAFVLGGHQALQDDALADERRGTVRPEPHVFAVSGGSYMAAALTLRRAFRPDGSRREDDVPWTGTYRPSSPEVERLRRHTRYLFEPSWRLRDGIVSMLLGALVNLLILALMLRLVAWLSSEIALATGMISLESDDAGRATAVRLGRGWDGGDWAMALSVAIAASLAIITFTLWSWWVSSNLEHDVDDDERAARVRWLGVLARARSAMLVLAGAWLALVLVVPVSAWAVYHATMTNQPTTQGATVLNGLGFGSRSLCTSSLEQRLDRAVTLAESLARVNPDRAETTSTGACGVQVDVVRTAASQGDADPANDIVVRYDSAAGEQLAQTDLLRGRLVVSITALLTIVGALLRFGPSPQAAVNARWWSRLRRFAVTWLPLAIMALLLTYLTLLWAFRLLVYTSPHYIGGLVLGTLLALALAYLIDANATSMHTFYRNRLASAFAVGVDNGSPPRAHRLDRGRFYRYSQLVEEGVATPNLHIVATANTQAPHEAPTMRGGLPLVFGASETSLHGFDQQAVLVSSADLERFVGPGRVSIMSTVAISGAAVSPLMGRYAVQMAPYRMLMALFNIRVGTWIRNPMHVDPERPARPGIRNLLWLTRKPGLAQVALEAAGRSSIESRWVYLSDGGHLDNTGLVECVRHCVTHGHTGGIVVLDASNDPVDTWSAVGDALSVVRADLGIDLRRYAQPVDEPPWMRVYRGGGLDVTVVKAVRVEETGDPAHDRWLHVMPDDVQSFQATHKDFPRASTIRQKFGDLEFEAYRAYGYAATSCALEVRRGAAAARIQELEDATRDAALAAEKLEQLRKEHGFNGGPQDRVDS